MKYLPIRKIAVAALVSALTWAAMRVGLNLGSDAANQAAVVITGLVFGYLEKDPRVDAFLHKVDPDEFPVTPDPAAPAPQP